MGWDAEAKKTLRVKRALIVWLTALLVTLSIGETRGGNLLAASTIELEQKKTVSYEAYGTRTAEQGSSEDRQKANIKDEDPTGLLNEGMRYRCLTTGVFLTRDPAGFVDGPNVYTYVRQNPWTKFDPFGLYENDWQRTDQEKDLCGVDTYKERTDLHAKSSAKTVSLISDFIPVIGPVKVGIETASEIKENGLSKEIVLGALADQALKRLGMKGKGTEVATALSSKSAKQTKKQAEKLTNKATNLQTGVEKASKGGGDVTVYRAFGGDSRAQGFSWTTKDPRTVSNFRDAAGLPSGGASGANNTADFLIQGKVNPADIIKSRPALPLDGNKGGLPELIIDPKNVNLDDFSVLKP